jgi:nicotinamidase-related amidase
MDLQNTILDRAADSRYLDRVEATQRRAETAGVPVILIRVAFMPGYPEISRRNKTFWAAKASAGMVIGDPAADLHPRLLRGNGETIVTKKRVSAFTGSELEVVLRGHDVTHLVLAGISTSGVVLSTVRQAADLDYELTVIEDLCIDPDPEIHRILVERVFPKQAEVTTASSWLP